MVHFATSLSHLNAKCCLSYLCGRFEWSEESFSPSSFKRFIDALEKWADQYAALSIKPHRSIYFLPPVAAPEAWLTASVAARQGSGFQPAKRCRHFGSTWNRYTAIKTGDCALTACHVHLTRPQKALMFTQEGTDDLQPDTLSRRARFLILYRADDTILHRLNGSGEITWCIGEILTVFCIQACLVCH